jgi:hypothetical protein
MHPRAQGQETFLKGGIDVVPSHRSCGLAAALALHAVVIGWLLFAARPPLLVTSTSDPLTTTIDIEYVAAAPPPPVRFSSEPVFEADNPAARAAADETPSASFPFDLRRIAAQRNNLFPFLTATLTFLDELEHVHERESARLLSPLPGVARTREHPPLRLSAPALQTIVDGAWSRRRRWPSLAKIVELTRAHDPDVGDLPALMRRYVTHNVLQPYVDGESRDARFWVTLGLSADHADVIEFIGAYVRQHPSSRTTTELLFLLDQLTQASRDALLMLLATDPAADLTRTKSASDVAYELAASLHSAYGAWLRQHQLDSVRAVAKHFDDLRLRILGTIVDTSPDGYGAADARFLAGQLSFNRQDVGGAVQWWKDMTPDERDSYAEARGEIMRAIGPDGTANNVEVHRILGGERLRWLDTATARLRRFGYTADAMEPRSSRPRP